ncbi:MAG: hypothetical protein HOW73_34035 [Polyangiaceae bacterium]|nr:hypothetical protein [Polyangiaceae bacterium]
MNVPPPTNPYAPPAEQAQQAPPPAQDLVVERNIELPPICLGCGVHAHEPLILGVRRMSRVSCVGIAVLLAGFFLLRGRVDDTLLTLGYIAGVATFSAIDFFREVKLVLPHCPTCGAQRRRGRLFRLLGAPVYWAAFAFMMLSSNHLFTMVFLAVIVGRGFAQKAIEPRPLIVKSVDPQRAIVAGVGPGIVAYINEARKGF